MKKQLSLLLVLAMAAIQTWAVKAYPLPVVVTQADGTQLTVVGHGGSDFHWYTTTDGTLLTHEGNNFYVAEVGADGQLVPTTQLAHQPAQRSEAERQLAKAQNRELFAQTAEATTRRLAMKHEPVSGINLLTHEGTPRVVVILAEFQDVKFTLRDPKKSFEQYLNGKGAPENYGNREDANYGSVAEYFSDMSGGTFEPQFDIYGPVTLPHDMKYYGGNNASGNDKNSRLLVTNACEAADEEIDFSQYDADDNGRIDLIYVIYAGYGENVSGNSTDCLWPKSMSSASGAFDGKSVGRCGISNELNGYPGAFEKAPWERINGIGLFCHEFSHCLGLPDLYPTTSSARVNNQALEFWSLMDGGEYVQNGYAPTEYTAWEREAMGWFAIDDLTESGELEIGNIDKGGKAYRIYNDADASHQEYFILQNIQQKYWNWAQKGHGLLVFHVNYSSDFSLNSNTVNDTKGKPGFSLVPADGLVLTSYNIDNKTITNADYYNQMAGDPFPGTSNVTELNETMGLPNFDVYTGTSLNKALANIEETSDGVIKCRFISDYATGIADVKAQGQAADKRIYTIDGREVKSAPTARGIYIVGRQKVVVK